jgi:hypothetical protein
VVMMVAGVVVVGRVAMVAMVAVVRQVLHSSKASQLLHPECCAACVCFGEGLLQRACLAVPSMRRLHYQWWQQRHKQEAAEEAMQQRRR